MPVNERVLRLRLHGPDQSACPHALMQKPAVRAGPLQSVEAVAMHPFNEDRFNVALAALDCGPSPQVFAELQACYREPGRHYHTDRHISACLGMLDGHRHLAIRPEQVEMAIWLHDAIHDTQRADSEARSADWCRSVLQAGGASVNIANEIADLILSTQRHDASDPDGVLLNDIDLAILGAEPAVFDAYDLAIRHEYGWVDESLYRMGRQKVLREFLERPRIYRTPELYARLERQARANLERAMTALERSL